MSVVDYEKAPNSRVAIDINIEEYYRIIRQTILNLSKR